MAENSDLEDIHINPWLSFEEHESEREKFIQNNSQQFQDALNSNKQIFGEYSDETYTKASELISKFFFGVKQVYRRFGNKYPIYEITYDLSNRDDYDGIAFNDEENGFVFKVNYLREMLEKIEKDEPVYSFGGAGIGGMVIPSEDFFEIAGVEEAAHLMFFNEKGHLGKGKIQGDNITDDVLYHSSDMESRALLWKSAYIKRYFPQYSDSIRETLQEVTKLRLEMILKDFKKPNE